ncbi:uncharacterized protein TNCV_3527261 [Trichonephila clavipes]|nr:uncharacterized protein TNCV_3527261 [Trichonephila clavipes]
MVRKEREEEKGGAGTPRDLRHIGEKLDNFPRLRLINLTTFRLEVLSPQTREYYQRSYQLLHCEHYSVDKIALAAKACLFEIFFRLLAIWRGVRFLIYFFFICVELLLIQVKIPKSNAQRGKSFVKEKKTSSKSSRKSDKKSANSSSASAKSLSEYIREDRARKKKHWKILS